MPMHEKQTRTNSIQTGSFFILLRKLPVFRAGSPKNFGKRKIVWEFWKIRKIDLKDGLKWGDFWDTQQQRKNRSDTIKFRVF